MKVYSKYLLALGLFAKANSTMSYKAPQSVKEGCEYSAQNVDQETYAEIERKNKKEFLSLAALDQASNYSELAMVGKVLVNKKTPTNEQLDKLLKAAKAAMVAANVEFKGEVKQGDLLFTVDENTEKNLNNAFNIFQANKEVQDIVQSLPAFDATKDGKSERNQVEYSIEHTEGKNIAKFGDYTISDLSDVKAAAVWQGGKRFEVVWLSKQGVYITVRLDHINLRQDTSIKEDIRNQFLHSTKLIPESGEAFYSSIEALEIAQAAFTNASFVANFLNYTDQVAFYAPLGIYVSRFSSTDKDFNPDNFVFASGAFHNLNNEYGRKLLVHKSRFSVTFSEGILRYAPKTDKDLVPQKSGLAIMFSLPSELISYLDYSRLKNYKSLKDYKFSTEEAASFEKAQKIVKAMKTKNPGIDNIYEGMIVRVFSDGFSLANHYAKKKVAEATKANLLAFEKSKENKAVLKDVKKSETVKLSSAEAQKAAAKAEAEAAAAAAVAAKAQATPLGVKKEKTKCGC